MNYRITYKISVFRDLSRIDKNEARKIVSKFEEELKENAEHYPILKGQFQGLRKFRVGDYRVIYSIINDDVLILKIAHRKDVYKIK